MLMLLFSIQTIGWVGAQYGGIILALSLLLACNKGIVGITSPELAEAMAVR
jgi:hypothetical protein